MNALSSWNISKGKNKWKQLQLQRNGWIQLISTIPPFFLEEEVKEFYEGLEYDEVSHQFRTSITFYTNADFASTEMMDLNVTELVRSCFHLPFTGKNISDISTTDANNTIKAAVESGTNIVGVLILFWNAGISRSSLPTP